MRKIVFLLCACFVFQSMAMDKTYGAWRDIQFDYRSEDPEDTLRTFSIPRFTGVASLTAVSFIAAYALVFEKGWWDEKGSDFSFDDLENDFEYALNLDKFGHFASGVVLGEFFYEGYYWSGVSEFNSYLYAGISAALTHVGIDVKDGFSPEWGFSVFDVLAGSIGGFYPMAKRYIPAFKYFDMKWSYWINTKAYYDQSETGIFTDDYVNQTFWCSFKVHRLLPSGARKYWPSWLAFAVGLSIDEGVYVKGEEGSRELYLALDYDLESFKPKARWARTLIKSLNYLKLPAPTVQVYPETKFFWLYPIKF